VTIDFDLGEKIVCTFTNERVTYELTYEKVVVGDPLGEDWVFTLENDGNVINPFTTIGGAGGVSGPFTLPLDAYDVGEIVPAGYALQRIDCGAGGLSVEFPASNDFFIILDQDMTCTFTNVQRGDITIVKQTTPDGAGQEFEFLDYIGVLFTLHDGESKTFTGFLPSPADYYTFTEDPIPDGWTLDSVVCESENGLSEFDPTFDNIGVTVTLGAGDHVTCTFNNVQETPQCTRENYDPAGDLTGNLYGAMLNMGTVTNNSQVCSYPIGIASYKMFDTNIPNQELYDSNPTWDGFVVGPQIIIGPGETLDDTDGLIVDVPQCAYQVDLFWGDLITDFGVQGLYGPRLLDAAQVIVGDNFCDDGEPEPETREISIQKISDDPGFDEQVYFTGDLGDFNTNGNGGLYDFWDLAPGVYNVTELVPEDWTLSSVSCNFVNMPIVGGDTVAIDVTSADATCVFTNIYTPAPDPVCDPEADLTGWLDPAFGYSRGHVTNSGDATCYVGIASYEMIDPVIDHQILFDGHDGDPVGPGETISLDVNVPQCARQIDLFYGSLLQSLNGQRYGTRLLDAIQLGVGNWCRQINPQQPVPQTPLDTDQDNTPDDQDNCPSIPNADQSNIDQDEFGDVCDDDMDGDGLSNADEGPAGTDPTKWDSDGDGIPDGQDPHPMIPEGDLEDSDNDGVVDNLDDCPLDFATNDADGDGCEDAVVETTPDVNP
jgi:hypothetical protein